MNPNRKQHPGNKGHNKGHKAWNEGLTVETNERIRKYGEKLH